MIELPKSGHPREVEAGEFLIGYTRPVRGIAVDPRSQLIRQVQQAGRFVKRLLVVDQGRHEHRGIALARMPVSERRTLAQRAALGAEPVDVGLGVGCVLAQRLTKRESLRQWSHRVDHRLLGARLPRLGRVRGYLLGTRRNFGSRRSRHWASEYWRRAR